jgi:hypothetical protein
LPGPIAMASVVENRLAALAKRLRGVGWLRVELFVVRYAERDRLETERKANDIALRSHRNLELQMIVAPHADHLPALMLSSRRAIRDAGTVETLCLDDVAESAPCFR